MATHSSPGTDSDGPGPELGHDGTVFPEQWSGLTRAARSSGRRLDLPCCSTSEVRPDRGATRSFSYHREEARCPYSWTSPARGTPIPSERAISPPSVRATTAIKSVPTWDSCPG